jgi:type IV secretion system protein VirD4
VRTGLESDDVETQLLAETAATKLTALHHEDERIRSSIYATARTAFEAWTEPSVAHSSVLDPRARYDTDEMWNRRPRFVDLDWLMGTPDDGTDNTLYLVAPETEFKRLTPVLGGLLGGLREQIHLWDIEGRRLGKPLLIVIDEAAQLELPWLAEEVSTIAGLGGMFVTCWQSKAQIDHRYGTLADAVLGGHRSKVVFAGCDDPATLKWLTTISGTEHVPRRTWSADAAGGRRSISETTQREDLLGPHVARQMDPGDAVLVHGTLPPVHIRPVRWWRDPTLQALVPTGPMGGPAPVTEGTCPVGTEVPSVGETRALRVTIGEALANLPGPARDKQSGPVPGPTGLAPPFVPKDVDNDGGADVAEPAMLDGDGDAQEPDQQIEGLPDSNREVGSCQSCKTAVPAGAGYLITVNGTAAVFCRGCTEVLTGPIPAEG